MAYSNDMNKFIPKIGAFLLTFALVFAVSGFLFPQTAHATVCKWWELDCYVTELIIPWIVTTILQLVSLLTGLSAIILNGVIYFTVVKVSESYANIPAINIAWRVIRDVANMAFIFVLLYAAIRTILGVGEDTKKLIVRIVVVAILINFSLFFTKIVIDTSNILALAFYEAMAPEALDATGKFSVTQKGLSNAFMQQLNLQSLYKIAEDGVISPAGIITVGIMGSIMLIIAAFVFFAAAILFVIRYVVLILVLILSPIAFIAFILPQMEPYKKQWLDALLGQAFFAPIYFLLTWVTLSVLGGVMGSFDLEGGTNVAIAIKDGIETDENGAIVPNKGIFAMFLNFAVIIVFLIASLIISKKWADRAGSGVSGLNKWAMGFAGKSTLGLAGGAARLTAGRMSANIADNEKLKEKADAGSRSARLALWAGRKGSTASYDIRGTALGGSLEAGKAEGKGGFVAFRENQAKKAEKVAKSYAPSNVVVDQAEQDVNQYEKGTPERLAAQTRLDNLKGLKPKESQQRAKEILTHDPIIQQHKQLESDIEAKKNEIAETALPEMKKQREAELAKMEDILKVRSEDAKTRTEEVEKQYKDGIKGAAERRKENYAHFIEKSKLGQAFGYNTTAATQIRKGKSKKEQFAESATALAKEQKEQEEPEEESQKPETPTAPPAPEGTSSTA